MLFETCLELRQVFAQTKLGISTINSYYSCRNGYGARLFAREGLMSIETYRVGTEFCYAFILFLMSFLQQLKDVSFVFSYTVAG